MAFNPNSHIPFVLGEVSVKSVLTGKEYQHDRYDKASKQAALDALYADDGPIIDANNARAGRTLSIRQHKEMLEGKFGPDPRDTMQRILEDGVHRDNTTKTEDDFGGNPIRRGADLENDRLWNTPAKRAMRDRLRAEADQLDVERAAEIEAEAAQKARDSDAKLQECLAEARYELGLARGNPGVGELLLAQLSQVVSDLAEGRLSATEYRDWVNARMDAKGASDE